ncbi:Spo0E family sporulation regulatory protein-aspartic acid phosphatase [Bacillus cereus]|uniref:Spo0E family sporulation regulatory protein-aspartic acid phosphatase n=1 Tax=Bacillus cereus TaxID=1396 RepID=A0A2A8ZQN9_BACCE|nr:Spo0E family sporulation regulatory protein-aspartic acid phosphatase [Bacillus cereus]
MEMENLQKLIEEKKQELIKLVEKYGFTHKQVLYLSQDIDMLVNLYIIIKVNEITVHIGVVPHHYQANKTKYPLK